MIVFDFDKTLTDRDTIVGFYRIAESRTRLFPLKRAALMAGSILGKLGLFGNDQIKSLGVRMFLRGKTQQEIAGLATEYTKEIRLNSIYYETFLRYPKMGRLIVSASFEEYLCKLLPDEKVVGSMLSYDGSRVSGVARNLYGRAKVRALNELGIYSIDELFTDSFSDGPLMEIASKVFLVKNGEKRKVKDERPLSH